MKARWRVRDLVLPVILVFSVCCSWSASNPGQCLTFCCSPTNDLFLALKPHHFRRFDNPLLAIQHGPAGSSVLILAEGYPLQPTVIPESGFAAATAKDLRLFLEYPRFVPGLEIASPRSTTWERIVISSDKFAPALPRLRILAAHDCHYVPVSGTVAPDLIVARVAGYDSAVFGIPVSGSCPILFEVPGRKLMVATTRLSHFVSARYAPARDWQQLWEAIVLALAPENPPRLHCQPIVQPAYSRGARLPRNFEHRAFTEAAHWFANSRLLVHASQKGALDAALAAGRETTLPPEPGSPQGDGSWGILEGYASGIFAGGNQLRRLPLRADCNCESAMVLALDGLVNGDKRSRLVASNLLDFVYFTSGMCQGPRSDPQHGAFGLVGWGDVASAWLVANYGDDNARVILATALAAAGLHESRWEQVLLRALLANFRTTGKLGFRGDRIDLPDLAKNGWRFYHDAQVVNCAPHFESYLWACYLWGYRQTGYQPLLDRTRTAIELTMNAYPQGWRWQNQLERARMLLCLAWLVRLENTPTHRQWLETVTGDLLADQQRSGAIYERLGKVQGDFFQAPQRNEDYGTTETPLLQTNGDPVSDQLYTSGFALLGLHEAAGATGDPRFKRAEDKLAEYLCRIQIRSKKLPYLNGTWFRALDDARWEAWASSADVGWGAWSIESGWGQAWTAAVLALRERKATLWDFTADSRVADHFARLKAELGLAD